MSIITYVHTARKETITIQSALEKADSPDMTKRILKARTQMVESMYEYFDVGLSESHRAKLYICTLLDPRFKNYNMWPTHKYVTIHTYAQCVCSVARLHDWLHQADMFLVWQLGRSQGKYLVWTKIRLRKRCVLPIRRARKNSEPQQHQDMSNQRRSINWRSG